MPGLHRAIRSFVIPCIILTLHATHLIQMSRKLRGKINMKLKAYSENYSALRYFNTTSEIDFTT